MLTGQDLIYFAPDSWDGLWRNRQQLMSRFAPHNKVLYVEGRPSLRQTVASVRQRELSISDFRRSSLRQIADNLFVFRYPLWASTSGRTPLSQFSAIMGRLALRSALKTLHMSNPIVWLHRPSMTNLIDDLPSARLLLYHVVDEYTAYGSVTSARRQRIEKQEKEMMSRVDAVIVVSEKLLQDKRPFNAHTYLVPNGVNYPAYVSALADPRLPDDLRAIKPPRLGYIGLIGSKLDLEMLLELAQNNPDWSLVLVGASKVARKALVWQSLQSMANVHHLGPVPVDRVPHYVKGFDVGLMPYEQNRHADYISPLKLYDYLAAGIPVASLAIPAVRPFRSHVHVADRPQDFPETVRAALADKEPEHRQARLELAAQNSWQARVEQLSDLIQTLLDAKPPR
jgi:glycosyltransferase involved in cell wall biosynthesis